MNSVKFYNIKMKIINIYNASSFMMPAALMEKFPDQHLYPDPGRKKTSIFKDDDRRVGAFCGYFRVIHHKLQDLLVLFIVLSWPNDAVS